MAQHNRHIALLCYYAIMLLCYYAILIHSCLSPSPNSQTEIQLKPSCLRFVSNIPYSTVHIHLVRGPLMNDREISCARKRAFNTIGTLCMYMYIKLHFLIPLSSSFMYVLQWGLDILTWLLYAISTYSSSSVDTPLHRLMILSLNMHS